MDTTVFCTFRQTGFHSWPDAPESYKYLSYPHRHEFHIRVDVRVSFDDRQIEFIALKRMCQGALGAMASGLAWEHLDFGARSCEMMAKALCKKLVALGYNVDSVEISEDGENGARFKRL